MVNGREVVDWIGGGVGGGDGSKRSRDGEDDC